MPNSVRERIVFVDKPGESGPESPDLRVDLLFIDASHERDATLREYAAWRPFLAESAVVIFDDYDHPDFPGVREAVTQLGLDGRRDGFLYITAPAPEEAVQV